ncbi:UDP-N-acetylglucosamine--N-acetylmuramyl-(pentapeptide) pyrophosphoryl-undecaprenol N-acetylglucosamine transferase [Clostridia bacterium]|nr:UDP-N-acetylglucosamine--N-acetylmuramyl-(pentapeptide) pyrophosphoryl-undecaprenol N-acetylglucosamine transferase [Clostridia bacterium]
MRLIFTCGGTAGHIYPAVAVANLVKARHPQAEILFVGAEGAMETTLVPREGYAIKTVTARRLRHKLTPAAIAYNAKTVLKLGESRRQAREILLEFKPDMVIGTGGYASYPLCAEAAKLKIPTAVHESNAMPGWTTRMLAARATHMLLSFEDSKAYYKRGTEVVGTPVRGEFFQSGEKVGDKPLIVSFWGSLGARDMNRMIGDFITREIEDGEFRHIHACGKSAYEAMRGRELPQGIELRQFIFDMPSVMNAADLVLCRAGASTLAELCAAGKPAILIPSPNVTNNHQERNARVLEKAGAAVVLLESDCNGDILYAKARELLGDKERLRAMSRAARTLSVEDSAERIYQVIMRTLTKQ